MLVYLIVHQNIPSSFSQTVYISKINDYVSLNFIFLRYNFIAKKLFRRLCQLGVEPLVELALADEQHPLG